MRNVEFVKKIAEILFPVKVKVNLDTSVPIKSHD